MAGTEEKHVKILFLVKEVRVLDVTGLSLHEFRQAEQRGEQQCQGQNHGDNAGEGDVSGHSPFATP